MTLLGGFYQATSSQLDLFFEGPGHRPPVIIVDLLHCAYLMYSDLDHICGGQGKLYEQKWRIFLQAFESAGIELVFVADGASGPNSKRWTWRKHRSEHLEYFVRPVFVKLVNGKTCYFSFESPYYMFTNGSLCYYFISTIRTTSKHQGLRGFFTFCTQRGEWDFLEVMQGHEQKYASSNISCCKLM
jgi:hypothetical protein